MRSLTTRSNWGGTSDKPELSQASWNIIAVPAIVLAIMAILQLISFGRFKDWLDSAGVGWPTFVAVVVIIAELWGALSLLQVGLGRAWRWLGLTLAVLVSGFWFFENVTQLTNRHLTMIGDNSGFFGRYLSQTPGWWSVIEIT
ncbi:MAG TPA: hypothetical protein VFK97_03520, partial [Candidatus Saccharimonadales bacterium]|nr:hypothetical protein [Candidatus Saccharimonadales bacterium]